MNLNLKKYLEVALTVTEKASETIFNDFSKKHIAAHKTDNHYGINEDIKINAFYENELTRMTPEVSVFSEEGKGNLDNELVWIIDPIEGTSNYRVGNPFYSTQIGLLHKSEPVIAVINAPSLKQRFHALKGSGAFLNNERIHVSKIKDLKTALLAMGKGTKDADLLWYGGTLKNILDKVRTFRHFGSCGLELAYTAAGKIDVYINKGSQIYDYAPGVLVVREAGGKVTDFNGNEWNLNEDALIGGNSVLLSEIYDLLKIS